MKEIIALLQKLTSALGLRPAIFLFCLSAHIAFAGLDKYSELVVADSPGAKQRPGTVRVTYLGVNGYQFEASGHALLVDPYFTRAGLTAVALQQRIEPNEARIAFGLQHIRPRADAVLVTHAHFDHLLDVPGNHAADKCAAGCGRNGSEPHHVMRSPSQSLSHCSARFDPRDWSLANSGVSCIARSHPRMVAVSWDEN
jgi:hypothetical protein